LKLHLYPYRDFSQVSEVRWHQPRTRIAGAARAEGGV